MNILITGGAGFLGSHLVTNLLARGYEVTIFDRKQKSRYDAAFFYGDIKDREAVFEVVNQTDMWVNLAGLLGTSEMMNNPQSAIDVNVSGALNVFDAARQCGKRGVQISVGNYWMNNPYAITKLTAEKFALTYNKERGTDIRVVRGMNAYGPGQKHRPVRKIIPNLVIPALLGEPITIYGDGEQVMDMIYVKDIVDILARVLLKDDLDSSIVYEAGIRGVTINATVALVMRLTHSISKVNHVPMRPGEDTNGAVQISEEGKARLLELGFMATQRDVAFQETIDWYKKHLEDFKWQG